MNENLSIEQLEHDTWQEMNFESDLVRMCFKYRRIPVKELSVEQLRMLIGQNIGVKFLLPKAVSILRQDILSEGNFYPGDLLSSVLSQEQIQWTDYPQLRQELKTVLKEQQERIEQEVGFRKLKRQINDFISS